MIMTAFIWDLDGTLIDSYQAIMKALEVTYKAYDFHDWDKKTIYAYILQESVGQLLEKKSKETGIALSQLRDFFSDEQTKRDDSIKLVPSAKMTLAWADYHGIQQFMYTHKGISTQAVLENLGIKHYFTEILTGDSGFERKPHPEGIHYLMKKYNLKPSETYYIGDRKLDVEVARNAGIFSINLTQPTNLINQNIQDLLEIKTLFSKENEIQIDGSAKNTI
ncbi:HAD-IA family hydrolase [Streptococcus sciuri]|uniref:HAD-IA family hydrolase n=1 Tax=Streptococcus sciuri TaxID=2973939 RepID=A0ABT2F510_9STRE|nr:HAD-IA family hydrolase [Streptococcus sciuri]MCS4487475.1 HAD-IA family hydrolase [Streptococcus sciuri]